jgi:hypothetical protein
MEGSVAHIKRAGCHLGAMRAESSPRADQRPESSASLRVCRRHLAFTQNHPGKIPEGGYNNSASPLQSTL